MKKLILSIAVFAGVLSASAQTPVGTVVSNFNLTDINGNTQNLFAMLDAGKMVVIDVSATWCGPCWNYHNTGALNQFYAAHGPAGADDARVLFIEGDATTAVSLINGIGTNTQGDWTAGTTFPLCDDAAAANTLQIGFFPTLYMICPSRRVWHISPSEVGAYWPVSQHIANARACANPIDAVLDSYTGETATCGYISQMKVLIQNKGVNTLTSAGIAAKVNGTTVAYRDWTGSLEQFQSVEVNVGANLFTSPSTDVEFTVYTTGNDVAPTDNIGSQTITLAPEVTNTSLIVKITTDQYGTESSWKIRKGNNAVLASGGPYTDLAASGTTVQPEVTVTLPAMDCYKFEMLDAYGDGMCCNYGQGGYEVTTSDGTVVLSGGEFGATDAKRISYGVTSIGEELSAASLNVYPNPSTGICNVTMNMTKNEDVSIRVYNMLGSLVSSRDLGSLTPGDYIYQVDLSSQASGVYSMMMITSQGVQTQLISINR